MISIFLLSRDGVGFDFFVERALDVLITVCFFVSGLVVAGFVIWLVSLEVFLFGCWEFFFFGVLATVNFLSVFVGAVLGL